MTTKFATSKAKSDAFAAIHRAAEQPEEAIRFHYQEYTRVRSNFTLDVRYLESLPSVLRTKETHL